MRYELHHHRSQRNGPRWPSITTLNDTMPEPLWSYPFLRTSPMVPRRALGYTYPDNLARPKWRNGRRGGLKNRCPQGHVGSTPTFGTNLIRVDASARRQPKSAGRRANANMRYDSSGTVYNLLASGTSQRANLQDGRNRNVIALARATGEFSGGAVPCARRTAYQPKVG